MRQLPIRVLVGIFGIAGVLAWAVAGTWDSYGSLPGVPLFAPLVLAAIAAALAATALSLRSRLRAQRERRPGAKGVEPMVAARAVVFGQASALVAAPVAGGYGGVAVFLLTAGLAGGTRGSQALYAGCSVVAGAAVVAAGLFLERVCRLPEGGDGSGDDGPGLSAA
ncbi:DUF3180 domain-containing protein [Streptomyces zingiberis]|uniref:DUF3180 domain-containing protein n=1 Tax=Streptomyces zingiberis TaxID=2053010 RepID=A0ABX1C678_9ACTN|nr:DUF3180 domain-containing protein [Streptomyces zingiberis]NJQ03685.1 DUF3180 domain-containing protein [Streptomyces zingiberis]